MHKIFTIYIFVQFKHFEKKNSINTFHALIVYMYINMVYDCTHKTKCENYRYNKYCLKGYQYVALVAFHPPSSIRHPIRFTYSSWDLFILLRCFFSISFSYSSSF
jgi:hypothetical protein